MSEYSTAAGRILRTARLQRALTLDDAQARSGSRFKRSSLGSYERGERGMSLDVFSELCFCYGLSPVLVLQEVLTETLPGSGGKIIIDLNRLSELDDGDARLLGGFVHHVRAARKDYLADVISLRSGDVQALAMSAGRKPSNFLKKLEPIVIRDEDRSQLTRTRDDYRGSPSGLDLIADPVHIGIGQTEMEG